MQAPKLIVVRFAVFVSMTAAWTAACTGRITYDTQEADGTENGGNGASQPGGGSSGTDNPNGNTDPTMASGARLSRLTHFQWQNAVKDLLTLASLPPGLTLQADAVLGFDNNNASSALDISFDLRGDYERAAEAVAAYVVNDATSKARLLPANLPTALEAKARVVIRALAERAYRRPLVAAEVDELWNLFDQGPTLTAGRDDFDAGLEVLITALLQSPFFLYRPELGEGENAAGFALTNFEVASRLSFALTDTSPDDELFAAARAGKLTNADEIKSQAMRLLKTKAAAASAAHFHEQLFRLASFDKIEKDQKAFPMFGSDMAGMLKEETRLFLDDVIKSQGTAADILTSKQTFVNAKLAAVYGLSGPIRMPSKRLSLILSNAEGC